jgi:hypothetical protein
VIGLMTFAVAILGWFPVLWVRLAWGTTGLRGVRSLSSLAVDWSK